MNDKQKKLSISLVRTPCVGKRSRPTQSDLDDRALSSTWFTFSANLKLHRDSLKLDDSGEQHTIANVLELPPKLF